MAKKILFITPDPPLPPSGGGRRSNHVLRALSKMATVDIVVLWRIKPDHLLTLKSLADNVIFPEQSHFISPKGKGEKILYVFKLIFPFLLSDYEFNYFLNLSVNKSQSIYKRLFKWLFYWRKLLSKYKFIKPLPSRTYERVLNFENLKTQIQDLLHTNTYSIAVIDYSFTGPLILPLLKGVPTIVTNSHNLEYNLYYQQALRTNDVVLQKWFHHEATIMKAIEKELFLKSDLVFSCSENDSQGAIELTSLHNTETIPNGVDVKYFNSFNNQINRDTSSPKLVFTGNMGYGPNVDAVGYFVQEIMPLIVKAFPNAIFVIAGSNANSIKTLVKADFHIEFIDSPDDMRFVYELADLCVVPLRLGSGTRLKILEAWAMKKPVVSTSLGAEGLETSENNILIANSAEKFAELCISLISNPEQQYQIGIAGRKTVEEYYDWQQIEGKIINVISKL